MRKFPETSRGLFKIERVVFARFLADIGPFLRKGHQLTWSICWFESRTGCATNEALAQYQVLQDAFGCGTRLSYGGLSPFWNGRVKTGSRSHVLLIRHMMLTASTTVLFPLKLGVRLHNNQSRSCIFQVTDQTFDEVPLQNVDS